MQRRSFLNSSIWLGFGGVLASPLQQQTRLALVKPRRLRKGDKVALINPAGATALRMDLEIVQERPGGSRPQGEAGGACHGSTRVSSRQG